MAEMSAQRLGSQIRDLLLAIGDLWRDDAFRPYLGSGYEREYVITQAEDDKALLPLTRKPIRGSAGVAVNIERRAESSRNRIRELVVESLGKPSDWKTDEESKTVQEKRQIIGTRVRGVISAADEVPGLRERMFEASGYKHYEPDQIRDAARERDHDFVFRLAYIIGDALMENEFEPTTRKGFDKWEPTCEASIIRLTSLASRSVNKYEIVALLNGPPVDSEVGYAIYESGIQYAISPISLRYADDALLSRILESSRSPVGNINTAIRYEVAIPVISTVHDYLNLYTVATIVAETIVDIIRLVREDDVGIEGLEVLRVEDFTPAIRPTYNTVYQPEFARYDPKRFAYGPPSNQPLSPGEADEIKKLLARYVPNSGMHSTIGTALRRFRISSERYTPDDPERLLDVAIALESLYLSDGNRQELNYRLSNRAAWFLGQSVKEREQHFETIQQLYKIRSTIAHGEALDPKQEETANCLLVDAPKLLRATLSKFIQGEGPPERKGEKAQSWWRNLVLGGNGNSN